MSIYLCTSTATLLQGARLVACRRNCLHLSLGQLAQQCDMAIPDLEMLEKGLYVPSPSKAYALALALGIDTDTFCNWALAQVFFHPQFLLDYAEAAESVAQG
jgi:transcriptional regulator with XRE-family HTH domain